MKIKKTVIKPIIIATLIILNSQVINFDAEEISNYQLETITFDSNPSVLHKEVSSKEKTMHEVSTCKDLESIGKGENYSGATHDETWLYTDNYKLINDIDCSASNPADINHDSSDQTTYGVDGFDPIGVQIHGNNPETIDGFRGDFSGDGYSINELYINSNIMLSGLFSMTGLFYNNQLNQIEVYENSIHDLQLNEIEIKSSKFLSYFGG